MVMVLDWFFGQFISDIGMLEALQALNLGDQYVCVTQTACDQVKIVDEKTLRRCPKITFTHFVVSHEMTDRGGSVSAALNKEMYFLLCGGETPPPRVIEQIIVNIDLAVGRGCF